MRLSKNSFKTILSLLMAIVFTFLVIPQSVRAQNSTAYTYTIAEDGKWVRTQDAYLAGTILFKGLDIKKPEDIFIKDNKVYIADTGNGRIVIMDLKTEQITLVGEGVLNEPTSVYVDDDNSIITADPDLGEVVIFSSKGEVVNHYKRPDSVIFGKNTSFKPRKAITDKRGNIYIVSEGSYDGIIQLSNQGEFLGYFGTNQTRISALQAIQDVFFTAAQKAKLFNRIPKTFYNVSIDEKGMIYSITQTVKKEAIKKHSVSGKNILNMSGSMMDEENFVDISVSKNGQIYAVTETGLVYEYDATGNLVYSFGGRAISTERNGLFTVVSGVAADDDDYVYVLDKERGIVQVFYPTTFALMTHDAINLFENGRYAESKELWEEILALSGKSRIAHNGLAKGYVQAGDYDKAAEHFKIAQNRSDYSEAFWEIRNEWLQQHAGSIMIGLVIFAIILQLIKLIQRKLNLFKPIIAFTDSLKNNRIIGDVLYLKNIIKHPIDSFYDIRKDIKGNVVSATIIYAIGLLVFAGDYLFRGFIFNTRNANDISYFYVMILFLLPCGLWVAGNYMVSSINEGEGRIKDVYCATAYSFAPLIIFMPFVTLLSYVVTMNEAFIIDFSTLIIWVWCAVALFIALKEIHDYEIRGVFKNIFLSLFFMFIAVIAFSIIFMLWDQGIEFVNSIAKEVTYRVN